MTGPISVAKFMRQCATDAEHGYYTRAFEGDRDPFGARGDFTTAPEMTQVFGELVGVWVVAEWMAQGAPKSGVRLVELGPGRGTLMADVLRVQATFRAEKG
jgi:NADH dehydrogenase [ubiquinone] 1 alpha subcomplex assembly factor 7